MTNLSSEDMRMAVRRLADNAQVKLDNEFYDRQLLLEDLIQDLRRLIGPAPTTARVVLFKPSGKRYTEEDWAIPAGAIGPHDMRDSPDFRRIDGGPVLVESQDPWGYPFLIV